MNKWLVEQEFIDLIRKEAENWLTIANTNLIQKNMLDIYDALVKNNSGNIEGSLALIYLLINIGPTENKSAYDMYKNICSYLFLCCDPPSLLTEEVQGNA